MTYIKLYQIIFYCVVFNSPTLFECVSVFFKF